MKRVWVSFLPFALLLFSLTVSDLFAAVRVRGFTRKDGTYVQPHYRSSPDSSFYNNWSTKGNVNPYTGKSGTKGAPPLSVPLLSVPSSGSYPTDDSKRFEERKAYWTSLGWDVRKVDADNSISLDQQLEEAKRMEEIERIEARAAFWKAKSDEDGVRPKESFKVRTRDSFDLGQQLEGGERLKERKTFWISQGMDVSKVEARDSFDLDRQMEEIKRIEERNAFWTARGWDVEKVKATNSFDLDRKLSVAEEALKLRITE